LVGVGVSGGGGVSVTVGSASAVPASASVHAEAPSPWAQPILGTLPVLSAPFHMILFGSRAVIGSKTLSSLPW
jgi:hypothetical protein